MVFCLMLDKFSAEIQLVNKLRIKLVATDWNIIQLVCSGGQAHFSISYKQDGKLKNIFPDVVAFNNDNIFIGEVKENFDNNDYLKLLELRSSEDGLRKLLKVITMRSGNSYKKEDIIFSLVHCHIATKPVQHIYQYAYNNNDFIFIAPQD
jgi:hypothetical protein